MSDSDQGRPLVVVMGISGSGKTTVGQALAGRLGVPYADADTFHSAAHVAKMAAGHPLDDADRAPWLAAIAQWLSAHQLTGAVVSCSALRRRYRDVLRSGASGVTFLHLDGNPDVVTERVSRRPGHFMPASLVGSQLDTLERLAPDEVGVVVRLDLPVERIVDTFLDAAHSTPHNTASIPPST